MEHNEKEALHAKSKSTDELLIKNAFMEFSLSKLNDELDGLRATVKKFQESCQVLQEEKSILVDEKSTILSQLQTITESVQKLLEKNNLLEKSLSDVKIELEGLKAKSSEFEELCKLLNDEKYNLLNERSMLVSQLERVEEKLNNLEKKYTKLEEKYTGVEKDRSTDNQVEELHASIVMQKEKHANLKNSNEARLENLEILVHVLQQERPLEKIEFEEELDKAVNAQVEMFIMQNCIEELEQKNLALLTKCEEHIEVSKFSDEVISELEFENLMQLIEQEYLLHEIRKFKKGMHQVYGALQIDPDGGHDKGIKHDEIPISHILDKIKGLKSSLVKSQEEKKIMEQEIENLREHNVVLQKDKVELLEKNKHEEHADSEKEERCAGPEVQGTGPEENVEGYQEIPFLRD
ncbi:hypothetical protein SESBI_30079 [Sesbania bispinosa]|nr:hypothetical protein SESBI_30079 [Sesbania bispinosa]